MKLPRECEFLYRFASPGLKLESWLPGGGEWVMWPKVQFTVLPFYIFSFLNTDSFPL